MALDGSVLYLSHFQFLFTIEGNFRCVMVQTGSHDFDVFHFFHKFTQKLYIFHWVLLYKWTFKIFAISITQEFHRLIYPPMVDAPECGLMLPL